MMKHMIQCEYCGEEMEAVYCCSGLDCGCYGHPINEYCSYECEENDNQVAFLKNEITKKIKEILRHEQRIKKRI